MKRTTVVINRSGKWFGESIDWIVRGQVGEGLRPGSTGAHGDEGGSL